MAGPVIRRLDIGQVDALEPVWSTLREHIGEVSEGMPPIRERSDSWERRRDEYHRWLGEPGSFCLVAEEGGAVVGYAMVRLGPGDDTWQTGERQAELETLAVVPSARGRGVGGALMNGVDEELALLGVVDLFVGVVVGNSDALRFYSRYGLRPSFVHLYRRG